MDDRFEDRFDGIRAAFMAPVNVESSHYPGIDGFLVDMISDLPDTETALTGQSPSLGNTEPRTEITEMAGSSPSSHTNLLQTILETPYTNDIQLTFDETALDWDHTDTEMSDDPQTSHQFHFVVPPEIRLPEHVPRIYQFPAAPPRPTHFALAEDIGTDYDAELIEGFDSPLQSSQLPSEFEDDYDPDGTAQFYLGDDLEGLSMRGGDGHPAEEQADSSSRQEGNIREQPRHLIYDPLAPNPSRHGLAVGGENDFRDPHLDTPIHGSSRCILFPSPMKRQVRHLN